MAELSAFTERNPGQYLKSDIYDPDVPEEIRGKIVPRPGSFAIQLVDGRAIVEVVASVHPTTLKPKFVDPAIVITNDEYEESQASIVSYLNDIFYLYYDPRTAPNIVVRPDSRLKAYGLANSEYRIVRYPDTDHEEVISLYYGSDGQLKGTSVPLALAESTEASKYFTDCHTRASLVEGEELRLDVYNQHGALVMKVKVFARQSTILNERINNIPVLTHISIKSPQMRGNNEIYIYEKQDVDSLNITVTLHYDDGYQRDIPVDGVKCILYGLEDFIASYAGLRQTILVKYFLDASEKTSALAGETVATHLTAEADLIVIPNQLAASLKISVIPRWNATLAKYHLLYYMYSADRDMVKNVTDLVSITAGTFVGDLYGVIQQFTISVDMSLVDPTMYDEPTIYQQGCFIKLQPYAAYERYVLQDASNTLRVYGVDRTDARRPVLHYDQDLQQYFIPSELFPTKEKFLYSFYYQSCPVYDSSTETAPLTPTHFILRDANTGLAITADHIPVESYTLAFSIIGDPGRYVNSNVIMEFLQYVDEERTLILQGVPVDCYVSAGGYRI